jgi:hypothetical protein
MVAKGPGEAGMLKDKLLFAGLQKKLCPQCNTANAGIFRSGDEQKQNSI